MEQRRREYSSSARAQAQLPAPQSWAREAAVTLHPVQAYRLPATMYAGLVAAEAARRRAARTAADSSDAARMRYQADLPELHVKHRPLPGGQASAAQTRDAQESAEQEFGERELAGRASSGAASFAVPSQAFRPESLHYRSSIVRARRPPALSPDPRDIRSSTAGNSRSLLVSSLV